MSKFDPIEGANYGWCVDCAVALPTRDDAKAHRTETMQPGRSSHSTRATNPSRDERIQSWVDGIVDDAITEALEHLQREVGRANATDAEIAEALGWYPDFADAWRDRDE